MRYILWLALFVSLPCAAVIETYQFENDELRARYNVFIDELRCPKCQNQNLSGSNSPIAADLRRELHRLLHEGKSDEEIKAFMVDRYGVFVLYRPPVDKTTVILWAAPVILLGIGAIVVFTIVKRQRALADEEAADKPAADTALSDQERSRLKSLLSEEKSE